MINDQLVKSVSVREINDINGLVRKDNDKTGNTTFRPLTKQEIKKTYNLTGQAAKDKFAEQFRLQTNDISTVVQLALASLEYRAIKVVEKENGQRVVTLMPSKDIADTESANATSKLVKTLKGMIKQTVTQGLPQMVVESIALQFVTATNVCSVEVAKEMVAGAFAIKETKAIKVA